MDKESILFLMSTEASFIIKTLAGILGGLLIAAGILPDASKDAFTADVSTVAGYTMTIISIVYLLEHAIGKLRGDFTTPITPTPSTPETPVQPTT